MLTLSKVDFLTNTSIHELFSRVPWKPGGLNTEYKEHEAYLNEFKNRILNKLKTLIKKSLDDEPELKSKKKIVEVGYLFRNNAALRISFSEYQYQFLSISPNRIIFLNCGFKSFFTFPPTRPLFAPLGSDAGRTINISSTNYTLIIV